MLRMRETPKGHRPPENHRPKDHLNNEAAPTEDDPEIDPENFVDGDPDKPRVN